MGAKNGTDGGDGTENSTENTPDASQESTQSDTKKTILYVILTLCVILLGISWEYWKVPNNENMDDVKGTIVTLKDQVSSIQDLQRTVNVKISDLQSSIHKEGDKRITDLRSDLAELREIIALKEDNDRTVNDLKMEVIDVKTDLLDKNYKQNELTNSVDILKSNLNGFNDQLTVLKNKIDDDVSKLKTENLEVLEKVNLNITDQINNARNSLTNVTNTLQQIEEAKTKIETTLTDQENLLSIVHQNTFNKASGIVAILLLYFLLIALAMYVLCTRPHGKQDRTLHQNNGVQNEILHPRVAGIPNANLANNVCVISFDEDTQNQYHRLLMTTVIEGLTRQLKNTLQVRYHVIRQNDEIRNIPPTKLYVIFADFSERHVIIEQRGIGLGDLKRTTYEKVCSLGGALMMVYVRDPGSRNLTPYRRYNAHIDCVQSQQELNDVNAIGRFFSVFETFTEFQLQCARNIIAETFEN